MTENTSAPTPKADEPVATEATPLEETPEYVNYVPPAYILGRSGGIAMSLFRIVDLTEGVIGLRRTEKELEVLSAISRKYEKQWRELLGIPTSLVPQDKKDEILDIVLSEIGCSFRFYEYMLELFHKGEMTHLPQIATDFQELNRAHRKEVDITVVTGTELSQMELEFYKSSVALDFLQPADNMIFTHNVDKSILGGYKVIMNDTTYDFTHNADIETTRTRVSKAKETDSKEEFFKSLSGVFRDEDIQNLYKTRVRKLESYKREDRA